MLKEFQEFILRGNVVDLAVAVVIGASFGAVVSAMVAGLITPLIAAVGGQPSFALLTFTINESTFFYGQVINAIVSFLIIAAVVFFFVVTPINRLMSARKTERPVEATTKDCPYCLSSVPLAASRCAFCTSELSADPSAVV